jgi:hypothetical protein
MATFRKPPRFKYRLDFGNGMGGSYTAGVVQPFVNMIINDVIVSAVACEGRCLCLRC